MRKVCLRCLLFITPWATLPFYVGCKPHNFNYCLVTLFFMIRLYYLFHYKIMILSNILLFCNCVAFRHLVIQNDLWKLRDPTFKMKIKMSLCKCMCNVGLSQKNVCFLSYLQHSLCHLFCLEKVHYRQSNHWSSWSFTQYIASLMEIHVTWRFELCAQCHNMHIIYVPSIHRIRNIYYGRHLNE